ncbi:hypothetical protein AcV7_004262 [Taiwanofungus camphoratus]|nr:hypothetical protein AcV7_004262 [Antrodia cinnamomea]
MGEEQQTLRRGSWHVLRCFLVNQNDNSVLSLPRRPSFTLNSSPAPKVPTSASYTHTNALTHLTACYTSKRTKTERHRCKYRSLSSRPKFNIKCRDTPTPASTLIYSDLGQK